MGGCFSKKDGTPGVAPQAAPAGRKARRHKKKNATVAFQLQNGATLPRGGSEPDLTMRSDVRWGQGDVSVTPRADASGSRVMPELEEAETHSSIDAGSIYGTPAGTPRSRMARLISGNDVFHDAQVAFTDSEDEFEAANADSLESDFGQSPDRRRQILSRLPTIPSALVVDGPSTSRGGPAADELHPNGGVAGKHERWGGEEGDVRSIRRRMSDPGPGRGVRKGSALDEKRPPPLRVESSPGGEETGLHFGLPKVLRKAATSGTRKHTPERERKANGTERKVAGTARRWSEYDARPDDEPSTSGGIVCLPKIRIGGIDRADSRGNSFRKEKKFFMFGRRSSGGAGFDGATPSDGRRRTVRMPRTGESVNECPEEQLEEGCWARVDAASFVLRGKTYMKDKKKILATAHPIYELLAVDCYHSVRKLMHVAQLMDIPCRGEVAGRDGLPRVLVVNLQFPLYPPAIFGGADNQDGEGFNVIMTFRLNADFERNPPPAAFAILKRFLADDQEKVGLMGSQVSLRDRLKLIASMRNLEEIDMSLAERKLANNYNGKPVLSRPQHVFYQNDNYLEIDIDVHRFSFLARKGLESFRQRLKQMVIDFALIIQGNKPDELPEHVLCCACVNKFDFVSPTLASLDEEQREHPDRSPYAPHTPLAKLGGLPHTL